MVARRLWTSRGALVLGVALLSGAAIGQSQDTTVGRPEDRFDRLVKIAGRHEKDLVAEYSADGGATWHSATIYPGTTIDQWRTSKGDTWNEAAIEGRIPAGRQQSVWNYLFDVPMPTDNALLRLKESKSGEVVLQQEMDLRGVNDVFVIDHRNFARLAGGSLPAPWTLAPGTRKTPAADSVFCSVQDTGAPPLVLAVGLRGWYRVYIGLETSPTLQFYLSRDDIKYPVPEYLNTPTGRWMQEFYLTSADLTGQDVGLALGGARFWRDASVRHIRFVPMTDEEVAHFRRVRELAPSKGRPFAGYVEQCTPAFYEPESLTLPAHTRNEMRLNKVRGSTDVYVHVIRVGSKAWYHSDVVDRFTGWGNWGKWMAQGDPLAVAITQGRAAGLKVFADIGMNVSYKKDGLREGTITKHPEYLCGGTGIFLDYRVPEVRDYAVSIATELMTKYDVDGINLDFARFACNKAFDEESLVKVLKRIHDARRAAEKKWGHPLLIATRIPSYMYGRGSNYTGEHPWFVAALKTWARNGWIDRVMACHYGTVKDADRLVLQRYEEAVAGTKVRLWGDLYGGGCMQGTPRSAWLDVARKWASQGLDGGFFFYTSDRPTEFEQINWQLRLVDFPQLTVGPPDR